jgi:hypothetical protein
MFARKARLPLEAAHKAKTEASQHDSTFPLTAGILSALNCG